MNVEVFTLYAYEPGDDRENSIGFDLQMNAELIEVIGEEEASKFVWMALETAYLGFKEAELNGPAISVDKTE